MDILTNNKLYANNAGGLLAAGGVIWVTNVIAFALWYWDLDRGQPHRHGCGQALGQVLMMLEAGGSIALAALVIARAINILQ